MLDYEKLSTLTGDELKIYLESIVKYYQDRLDEQMRKVSNEPVECQHEPQPDFVHPGSPGFKKGYVKMCVKCHEEYVECQHESDGSVLFSCPGQYKCTKCGEFYR